MKKTLALLLCIATIFSALTFIGCGKEEDEKNTEASSSGETEKETSSEEVLSDDIPDGKYDFGGRDFIITVPAPNYFGADNYDMQELTNDIVYDEVYYRNREVESRFNVKISTLELGLTDSCVESLQPHILSDDGAFNLIAFAYSTGSYGLISSDLLCPWNDIPVINYSKPWWNDSAVKCGTLNGTMFFNAGSFNWYSLAMTTVFYFNETIRQQNGIEDLYALVENGEWTLDKLQEFSRLVAKDDGNGKWNKKDTYGLVTNCIDQLATGCGFEVVTKNDEDNTYTVNVGNEFHQRLLERIVDIMKKSNHLAYNSADMSVFTEERALFMADWLFNINQLRSMESDFGIIPYPKFDENQENYCSFSQAWGLANALPICTKPEDYEFIGVVLEALSCISYNKVMPAYYEYTLKGRESRDTESWRMLDLINNTLVYDFGYFYSVGSSTSDTIFSFRLLVVYGREKTDLASFVAENQDSWKKHYDEVMEFGK